MATVTAVAAVKLVEMPRAERDRARRRGLLVRGTLAVVVAVVGYWSVTDTLANVLAKRKPDVAERLSPGNSRVAAQLALRLSDPAANVLDRRRGERLARQALVGDATETNAVVALGINAEVRGDHALARRLFTYSQQLSRRDLTTQLWAIEASVAAGNVAKALTHYDIALRTSPRAPDVLFPVLATASADPAIRPALVRLLAARPPWGGPFIAFVADKSADPRAAAGLITALQRAKVAVAEPARATVINALAAGGYADETWRFYVLGQPDAQRTASRDPDFRMGQDNASRLDWATMNNDGISSSIQQAGKNGVFEFSVPQSVGGAVLQQLQLLPPGNYRLSGRSSGIAGAAGEQPFWRLTCHDGRELGRVEVPPSAVGKGVFSGAIVVPPGCGIQMLALIVRAPSDIAGATGQIDYVKLEPSR